MRLQRFVKCEKLTNFVEKQEQDKAVAVHRMNLFKDNAVSHFYEILKGQENQVSLHRFLVKTV